jgi:hypothetical protein
MSLTFDDVRQLALSFPGVTEHTVFGAPTFRVGRKFLASTAKIDPDALCLKLPDQLHREFLVESQPDIYYAPPHYADFGSILIRLSQADPADVRDLFEQAWRAYAPKKLVASYGQGE